MSSTNQQLQQAFDLIKAGKKAEAVKILTPIVTFDEDNANAWWLMANASELPEDIREALGHVLRLKPDNDKAQQMLDRLNERYPPKRKAKNDDFSFDDPFADQGYSGSMSVGTPQRVVVTNPRKGTNPLVIVLAIIGVLTLVGCLVCVGTGALGAFAIVQEVANDPTFQAAINDPTVQAFMQEVGDEMNVQRLDPSVNIRGDIQKGTTESGSVSASDEGWTFTGELRDTVVIEANAVDSDFPPQLYLYNNNGDLIEQSANVEAGTLNSRLEISLPYNGSYTIVVSGTFGIGGDYELTVS